MMKETYEEYKNRYVEGQWRLNLLNTEKSPAKFFVEMWQEMYTLLNGKSEKKIFGCFDSENYRIFLESFNTSRKWEMYILQTYHSSFLLPNTGYLLGRDKDKIMLCIAYHLNCMHEENRLFGYIEMVKNEILIIQNELKAKELLLFE